MTVRIRQVRLLFWGGMLTGFLFLCYQQNLAKLITPCMACYLLFEIRYMDFFAVKGWNKVYCAYLVFLCISLLAAVIHQVSPGHIVRFLFILLLIPVSSIIHERKFEDEWKIFKILMILKALTILVIWIYAFIKQDVNGLRFWARNTGAGDIYNFYRIDMMGVSRWIPKIQLRGNTVFVMAFGINLQREKKLSFTSVLFLAAGLAAGNSAYVLGYALFIAYVFVLKMKSLIGRKSSVLALLLPIGVVFSVLFLAAGKNIWIEKSGFSNAVRYRQAVSLLNTNPIIGSGLGNDKTGVAGYEAGSYYELQTLYVYNQIGMIGLALFYVLTFSPYVMKKDRDKTVFYFVYLAYTFWNPYCFDSTHIIAILLISNAVETGSRGLEKGSYGKKQKRISCKKRISYCISSE